MSIEPPSSDHGHELTADEVALFERIYRHTDNPKVERLCEIVLHSVDSEVANS